jgi:hypothetical protein
METKSYQPTEIDEMFQKEGTLKGVITAIENDLYQSGRVVCKIVVNGMNLTLEDEIKFESASRTEIAELEVASQTLTNLIQESRKSLATYFINLKSASLKGAEALRAGVVQDANDIIRAIIDGTSWATDMLNQIRTVDAGISGIQKEWIAAEAQFIRVNRELLLAFERSDTVLLADNLEYEWSESLDQWLKVLSLLDNAASNVDNGHE